jgi:hypothetical protein
MLAHSPRLPLVIDYVYKNHDITAEDEKGAIHALKQRERVRRVRLVMPVINLHTLVVAINWEYPILEYLIMHPSADDGQIRVLVLPETLHAPRLRHLALRGFALRLPIGSRLFTTSVGLVTLFLSMGHPSTFFHPTTLLRWLSFMPRLQVLVVTFFSDVPSIELMPTPITTPVTLPNLHFFGFQGVSSYLEAFVPWIATPRLGKLQIAFFNRLTLPVPRLLQFMNTTENLKFRSAKFEFSHMKVDVKIYPREEAETHTLSMIVHCRHLDWQVSSVARIFNPLSLIFSAVEHLTLERKVASWLPELEEHNEVDRTEWRELLGSFSNVKTLRIAEELVEILSRCLQLEDGELALGLLPELQELTYSGSGDTGDAFASFVDARQIAGRPVTLVHRSPSPDRSSCVAL